MLYLATDPPIDDLPPIDYLVIGHVTRDLIDAELIVEGGEIDRIGGTVAYAALTAHRSGYRAGIVTAASLSLLQRLADLLPAVAIFAIPTTDDTIFANKYTEGGRVQYLHSTAPPFSSDLIPLPWRSAPIIHLGPVAGEIPASLVATLHQPLPPPPQDSTVILVAGLAPDQPTPTHSPSLILATPQGWLRRRESDGRVQPAPWPAAPSILSRLSLLIFSDEDTTHSGQHTPGAVIDLVALARQYCPLWVETRGENGALVSPDGREEVVPALPATPLDPTGAGDVFAAAMAICYHESGDPLKAARYAHAAAALSIEAHGLAGVPERGAIIERLSG